MGRPAKYPADTLLDVALELLDEGGARAVSAAEVARRLGAPSGSLYHRFPTRDSLLVALWLRTVGRFQSAWVEQLELATSDAQAVAAALWVVAWCRDHLVEARALLLHRREDLLDGAPSPEVQRELARQSLEVQLALQRFARRRKERSREARERHLFALVQLPYAAARPALAAGRAPPRSVDRLVSAAAKAVLNLVR